MSQDTDWSQRQLQIFKAIADNAGAVIGAVMKAMAGTADAARVRELVLERAAQV